MQSAVLAFFTVATLLAGLTQCASESPEGARPKTAPMARAVSIPTNLNGHEEQCLGELEDALKQAGFSPVRRPGGAYQLELRVTGRLGAPEPSASAAVASNAAAEQPADQKQLSFSLPGGPLQAVVAVALRKGARVVAAAEGKFEGPRAQFTADEVVQGALHRCVKVFSTKLQAANEMATAQSGNLQSASDY